MSYLRPARLQPESLETQAGLSWCRAVIQVTMPAQSLPTCYRCSPGTSTSSKTRFACEFFEADWASTWGESFLIASDSSSSSKDARLCAGRLSGLPSETFSGYLKFICSK